MAFGKVPENTFPYNYRLFRTSSNLAGCRDLNPGFESQSAYLLTSPLSALRRFPLDERFSRPSTGNPGFAFPPPHGGGFQPPSRLPKWRDRPGRKPPQRKCMLPACNRFAGFQPALAPPLSPPKPLPHPRPPPAAPPVAAVSHLSRRALPAKTEPPSRPRVAGFQPADPRRFPIPAFPNPGKAPTPQSLNTIARPPSKMVRSCT